MHCHYFPSFIQSLSLFITLFLLPGGSMAYDLAMYSNEGTSHKLDSLARLIGNPFIEYIFGRRLSSCNWGREIEWPYMI